MSESDRKTPRYIGPDTSKRIEKMSRAEIQGRFDKEVASLYSQREPVWLPEFKYMFGLIPKLLQPYVRSGGRVLDIGAGTGNLSRSILEALPEAKVVLMDFSANMLSEVPNVLAQFPGGYETVVADFIDADLGTGLYAAVVASFAIHHCRGIVEYGKLYRNIFTALGETGIFVCGDVVSGADQNLIRQNENEWRAFLSSQGLDDAEVERILSNYHVEDSPIDLWSHLSLLKEAGFKTVEVVWKKSNFSVYAGIKA